MARLVSAKLQIVQFIICLLFVSSVVAQNTIDEITVTADFRVRPELYIPSSISVLDKVFI